MSISVNVSPLPLPVSKKPAANSKKADNVKVAVRCRPMNSTEKSNGNKMAVVVDEKTSTILVHNPNDRNEPPRKHTYDNVYGPDSIQADVYNSAARDIVDGVLAGYNGTVFAYGQTGTGKTFTMEGDRKRPEMRGIIPNSFAHIFDHVARAAGTKRFLVRASYCELYQEEVRDLLGKDAKAKLKLKERTDSGVYVEGLSSFVAKSADDLDQWMTIGNRNRSVGATDMNLHSSRSHAIFQISVECAEMGVDGNEHIRAGKLNLVDLAGSERQSKTHATGDRFKEATKINLSLSTLGNVISALVDGRSHIPYRDSKLTRLLEDSLGGNAKTLMIAAVGPADYNTDETLNTLRYATRAKSIKNAPRINEDPKDALLRQFQEEIKRLKAELEASGGGRGDGSGDEDEETSATGASSSEYETNEEGNRTRKKKKNSRRVKRAVSPERLAAMQAKIEAEKIRLKAGTDIAEGERQRIAAELRRRQEQVAAATKEREEVAARLQKMEENLLVGGVNLLDKAEEQARLLDESNARFREQKEREAALHSEISAHEEQRIDLEEVYASLQEEAKGKERKLKKVWTMFVGAKQEISEMQQEMQQEQEAMLAHIHDLTKELRLKMLLIDQFVPTEFQEVIESYATWSDDIDEWSLQHIAHAGNNVPKPGDEGVDPNKIVTMYENVYLSYEQFVAPPVNTKEKRGGQSSRRRPMERAERDRRPKEDFPIARGLVKTKKKK